MESAEDRVKRMHRRAQRAEGKVDRAAYVLRMCLELAREDAKRTRVYPAMVGRFWIEDALRELQK